MKKLLQVILLFIAAGILAGCTALAPVAAPVLSSYGSDSSSVQSQTTVNLAADNFIVTQTNVMGRSRGFSLLGFIPIYPARLTTALDRLYAKSAIEAGSSKSLAHLTIEHSSTFWILFSIPETTLRAQVVQFKSPITVTNRPAIGS